MRTMVMVGIALSLVASGLPALATDTPAAPVVRYESGRLSVDLHGIPAETVLAAIGEQTGATVESVAMDTRTIDARFEGVPLEAAFEQLFPGSSTAIRYGRDGDPVRIELLQRGQPAVAPGVPVLVESAPAADDRGPRLHPSGDEEWTGVSPDEPFDRHRILDTIAESRNLRRHILQQFRRLGPRKAVAMLREHAGDEAHKMLQDAADDPRFGRMGRLAVRLLRYFEE